MGNYTTYPNITDLNFSSGPVSTVLSYGNTITGGLLAPAFLFLISTVALLALYTPGRGGRAFLASGLVALFLSFAMMGAAWLHPFWFFASIVYAIMGVYIYVMESSY